MSGNACFICFLPVVPLAKDLSHCAEGRGRKQRKYAGPFVFKNTLTLVGLCLREYKDFIYFSFFYFIFIQFFTQTRFLERLWAYKIYFCPLTATVTHATERWTLAI